MTTAALVANPFVGPPPAYRIGSPLTERVLDRLPGPRIAWLVAWGLSPFAAYEIAYRVWQLPTYAGVANNLTFAGINLIGLWAAGILARHVDDLQPVLEQLLRAEDLGAQSHPFRRIASIRGPLAVAGLFVLGWDFLDFLRFPGPATGFATVTIFVGVVGIASFAWVYVVSLVGLDLIGRRELRLGPFATDTHLGLKPLGSLAFQAFVLCALAVVPALLWLATDVRSAVETLAFVGLVSGLFVLSAYTLHRQLAAAKARHLRWARGLVEAALRPIEERKGADDGDPAIVDVLAEARSALAAATEIERRAIAIQEWPFDAAIVRAFAAILTSVTAVIIARLLLSSVGM